MICAKNMIPCGLDIMRCIAPFPPKIQIKDEHFQQLNFYVSAVERQVE